MLLDKLGKELIFLDGGMGTLLQEKGLMPGELPETWNMEKPEIIREIHRSYHEAGSRILLTNTFGANAIKYHGSAYSPEEVISAAVRHVKAAGDDVLAALDIGPTGKLLKPFGDLSFESAYDAFSNVVRAGAKAGADLIHIETMSDTYEAKAAILAAKENSSLPVFVTMIFNEEGKLLTGGDIPSAVALLEGLRVDALGVNCGMGPAQMLPIVNEIAKYTSLPIIAKPNAGLPKQRDGKTYYDVTPDEFASSLRELVRAGASIIGGCCGTTPEHIRAMISKCGKMPVKRQLPSPRTIVSSYGKAVELSDVPVIIGERINPTGKKRLKQALKERDFDYLLKEAVSQQDNGAHILDVNVGLPGIDEVSIMKEAVSRIQAIVNLPLQIDTADAKALDSAMRIYNGKPMVNSVNGKQESMDAVFPLIRKYGGVVVALTLDENGIPDTACKRADIAGKIIKEAGKYGISRKDIVVDVLTMTVSADPGSAATTLSALRLVRERYGVKTVLGVSNISFGLPDRPLLNANFYTMALQNGLSAGIINPSLTAMTGAYKAFCALMGYDANFSGYIEMCEKRAAENETRTLPASTDIHDAKQSSITPRTMSLDRENLNNSPESSLIHAVEKGLKEEAKENTIRLLKDKDSFAIIRECLIPALDTVGKGFESGTLFLPQLLMSAEAAKQSFEIIKEELQNGNAPEDKKDKVILATVKGDIHDIGKNIVKILLENYNFDVIDLGKDVPPETVLDAVLKDNVRLVGLSALMTTTVVNMEKTIKLLKEKAPECKVMVGGAVLNQEYADQIGADFYSKDAMQSVYYAQGILQAQ